MNTIILTGGLTEELSTQANFLEGLWDKLRTAVPFSRLITTLILLLVCLTVAKLLLKMIRRFFVHSHLEKGLQNFLYSIIKVLLLFVTIMLVASSLGIDTSSLLAVLSVAGLAVSLAIQDSFSNLASGVMILTAKPFKVGDYVKAGDVEGTVQEIGIIYTRMATADNRIIHIPNGSITAASIINYSAERKRRIDLQFSAASSCPIETVKAALLEAANLPLVDRDIPPQVFVQAYGEHAITYLVRLWTANEDYWSVYYQILDEVQPCFARHGIAFPQPRMDVHLTQ